MREILIEALLSSALLTPLAAHGAVPTVGELIGAYASMSAAGPSSDASGMKLAAGHLSLTLKSGTAVPVKAGDETVGLFFKGTGVAEYEAADPFELPVVALNVKKATSLTPEKGEKKLTLRCDFTELLWLASGGPPTGLKGASGPPLAEAFRAHRERLARLEARPASHEFAAERLDAPSAAVVRAEMTGGKEDLLYTLDPVTARSESLGVVRTVTSIYSEERNRLWLTNLSRQPLGLDPREAPVPRFALADVAYTLRASDGRDASLSVTETLVPVGKPISVLSFGLDQTLWDVSGSGNVRFRTENVRSVRTEDGTSLSFHHEHDSLVVGLPSPAAPGKPFKLTFEIDGDFLIRPQGDSFWLLRSAWFPEPEPSSGQQYTVHATVRVKKPFVPFAPGVTRSRRVEGDETVLETELENPIDFAVVLAGKYRFVEETRDGLTVRVASYAVDSPKAYKKLANLAFTIVKYYETFLGPFPFPELNILEINDYGWGQAPPGTMFITSEAFSPMVGDANQFFSGGINHRFAHEIAHQYWGTVVKRPSYEEQWLEEAFAEYSAALFIRDAKGKGDYEMLVAKWRSRAKLANDVAPIPLANRIEMPGDRRMEFQYRTALLYGKGPYLLSLIHRQVGDDTFFTFLKSYQKTFRWKFGSTKHVAGLLGFLTKKDYGPFFEANYWGMELPKE